MESNRYVVELRKAVKISYGDRTGGTEYGKCKRKAKNKVMK